MIHEFVSGSYIKYEIRDRKHEDTNYVIRKKQKDLVKLKKLLFASLSIQDTILLYKTDDGYKTIIANFNFKHYPTIPLKFTFYNKRQNSYLTIRKFPVHDITANTDLALDLDKIEEVIIPTSSLDEIELRIENQKFIT
jgi:hypothetical protein